MEHLRTPGGELGVEMLGGGRHRITVLEPRAPGARLSWVTSYPLALVSEIHAAKGRWVCDEIMRDEDPRYVEHAIRHEVFGYVEPERFAGRRVLDFGCGAGASSMVLKRLLPPCEIVGVELQERLLDLARLRAAHYGAERVRFVQSPSGDRLPAGIGVFDFVIFSAVFEHLLPAVRGPLLALVWRHLATGGVLFLNQTPQRWAPVEVHTTWLPLINYLPDRLAHRAACAFSGRVGRDDDWPALLRAGIRGGTVGEILGILEGCGGRPALLEPRPAVGDAIDLWYGKLSARHRWLKRGMWAALKALKPFGSARWIPELSLAIRKAG